MPVRITRVELVPGTGTGKAPKALEKATVRNRAGEEVEIVTRYAETQGHFPGPHYVVEWDVVDTDGRLVSSGSWEVEATYPRGGIRAAVAEQTGEEIIDG